MAEITRIEIIETLMGLRAKSWRLSLKEDNLLSELHSTIVHRSILDREIDRLEIALEAMKKEEAKPKKAWSWTR